MNKVNQFLCNNNPEQMFVTAFAGILDLQTGLIEYVDAGHEPPFIMRKTGQVERIPKTGGIVLGFIKEHNFLSGSLFLQPGDSIVLYTDGVSEAMNSERRPFGDKAIEKTLIRIGPNRGSREVVTAILSDLQSHVKGYRQSDDIATLVVRYLEPCN
jgi:sigma-B regulation protein RsbU (phosphoserine phosphatase)